MKNIHEFVDSFCAVAGSSVESGIEKIAAKDKVGRNKLSKILEKAKKEHSVNKRELDSLEAEDRKLRAKLEKCRKDTSVARGKVMKLHNAMQCMDVADASDVIFYDDDVAYIVDSKEYHLEISADGDIKLTPWREHRRAKKNEKKEEVSEETNDTADSEELNSEEQDLELEGMDSDDIKEFYNKLWAE